MKNRDMKHFASWLCRTILWLALWIPVIWLMVRFGAGSRLLMLLIAGIYVLSSLFIVLGLERLTSRLIEHALEHREK